MLIRFLKVSIAASSCLAFGAMAQEATVTFPNGATVTGVTNGFVDSFLGIQYGTVGEQRFSRSSLLTNNDEDVINATAFGPDCYQSYPDLPFLFHQPRPEAEECLFLNIWRPAAASSGGSTTNDDSSTLLPIMVWIHGGGLMIGSGAEEQHRGDTLAADQNVMVISINYRLGALGFLPQDDDGFGAMNGLWDQIVALQWIQANAVRFGGDVTKVTIFGESSGSESVCMLSVSPLAQGLFHRAIMQSGDCVYNPWMGGVPKDDIDIGLEAVDSLLNATGVSSLEELQDPSMVDGATLNLMAGAVGWHIVLDKEVLPEHPRELYQDASNIVPTDFLIGANSVEDLTFWGMTPDDFLQLAASPSGLNDTVYSLVGSQYGPDAADTVYEAYEAESNYDGDTAVSFAQFSGDWFIGCPSRVIALDIAEVLLPSSEERNVYLYQFAHFAITDPMVWFGYADVVNTTGWASHSAEIPYVFGTMDFWLPADGTPLAEVDYKMNHELMTRWASFAKTGSPNLLDDNEDSTTAIEREGNDDDGMAVWEPLSVSSPRVMLFQDGQGQMSDLAFKAKQCAAFPFGNEEESENNSSSASSQHNLVVMWSSSDVLLFCGFFVGILFVCW
jgi:para-nitrobenzyl esterase